MRNKLRQIFLYRNLCLNFMILALCIHLPSHLSSSRIMANPNLSYSDNIICDGSPSRIRRVRRISFGMTTLPKSSILLTIPVAFMLLSSSVSTAFDRLFEVIMNKNQNIYVKIRFLSEKTKISQTLACNRSVYPTISKGIFSSRFRQKKVKK